MKKQLLIFAALLAYSATYAADLVAPVRTMVIPIACTNMAIDGVDDELWWSAWQTTDAFNPTGSTGADADYTFTFKVCYDLTYLYVYGKILDDYESDWEWGGSNQWTFDNVEVFVNLDTNGTVAAYDSNTYQLRINRGIDSIGNDCGRPGNNVMRPLHKYYWENTADGWIFEAALNWRFVLGLGQKPEDVLQYLDGAVVSGFDMSGADSDTDGADHRDCQTAWDNDEPQDAADRTEDNAWNNRNVFGIVTFSGMCGDIKYNAGSSTFEIFPNPVGEILTIDNSNNFRSMEICNSLGQIIYKAECINGDNKFNVSDLPGNCIYFLRLTNSENLISTAKFMKE